MSERFWEVFKVISDGAGLFIIRRDLNKNAQQKLFQISCIVFYTIITSIIFYTAFQKDEGIVIQVVCVIFVFMTIVLTGMIVELISNEDAIDEFLKWCSEPGHKKFHQSMQPQAGNRFNLTRNICTRLTWFNYRLFTSFGLFLTFIVGMVMQIFPSLRYKPPIPWHFPIANYRTWEIFSITLVMQMISTFIMSKAMTFFICLVMVYFIQMYQYLKITIDGIYQFNQKYKDKKIDISVDESLKILIQMILSAIRIMAIFTKMMKNIVLSFEIVSFFSILANASIVLIEKRKEHYLIGTAILMFNVIALAIAFVNDTLKEKVNQVMIALYDLPWDEFSPKQRRLIRFAMSCVDMNVQFNSAGMHEFNLERFGQITKQAYSNTLVLKKMIEKSMGQHNI